MAAEVVNEMDRKTRNPLRLVPRWLWLCLAVVGLALIVVNLTGCFRSGGGVGGWFGSAFGGGGGGATGPADDGGGALPSLWGSAARSFARIDWWLGLGSGISVLTGVYRLLRGDVPGGVLAVAVGIGLALVTLIVGIIFPLVFPIIAFLTFAVGGIVAYRLATGRGIGGHSIKCLWARVVAGPAAHRKAHKVRKA